MTEHDAAQVPDDTETTAVDEGEAGMADAVDDRAAALTGSQGASRTDAPVADNRGPVAQAEEHLEDTNLAADRETLKKLQSKM